MLWAEGGGMELSQWDTGVWLFFDEPCDGLTLSLESVLGTHPAEAVPFGGIYRVRVPDELLWQSGYLRVTLLVRDTDGERAAARYRMRIRPRQKPRDYIRGTDERTLLARLVQRVEALEKNITGIKPVGDPVRFDEDQVRTAKERAQACDNIGALSGDVLETEVVNIVTVQDAGSVGQVPVITGHDEDGSPLYENRDLPSGAGGGLGVDVRSVYGTGTADTPITLQLQSDMTYYFAAGVYYVAAVVSDSVENVTVYAEDATVICCGERWLDLTAADRFTMVGGTVDGGGQASDGIRITHSRKARFSGVKFQNVGSAQCSDAAMLRVNGDCSGIVVADCIFDGCTAGAVYDDGYIHAYGIVINRTSSDKRYTRYGTVTRCTFDNIAGQDITDDAGTVTTKADGDGIFIQVPPYLGDDGNVIAPEARILIARCVFGQCKKRGIKAAARGAEILDCSFDGEYWYAAIDSQYGYTKISDCDIINRSDYNGSVTSAVVVSDGGVVLRDCRLSAPYGDTFHPGFRTTTRLPSMVNLYPAYVSEEDPGVPWEKIVIDRCTFDGVSRAIHLYNSNEDADKYVLDGIEITRCVFGVFNQTHAVNISTTVFAKLGTLVFRDFRFVWGEEKLAIREKFAAAFPDLDREFILPISCNVPITVSCFIASGYYYNDTVSAYDFIAVKSPPKRAYIVWEGEMGGIRRKVFTASGSSVIGTKAPDAVTSTLGMQLLYASRKGDTYTDIEAGTQYICTQDGSYVEPYSVGTWKESAAGAYEDGMEVYF